MDIREILKNCIREDLGTIASPIFMERANETIDSSPLDRDGHVASSDRIRKMVKLFIDEALSEKIFNRLMKEIDKFTPS